MFKSIIINLIRFQQDRNATLGKLLLDDKIIAYTLERPWLNNQNYVSCIPEGLYQCVLHNGDKFQNVWELLNVPGRSSILIHNGNFVTDTDGCILVGQDFAKFKNIPRITNSIITLNNLRNILPPEFQINIKNIYESNRAHSSL